MTPADEGVLAVKIDDAIAARHERMVEAINQTIGALRVHRHWKDTMPDQLIAMLESALAPEDRP